ncbi:iron-sulfur cluster assembly scaffold protein IscU/NifU-like [Hydrogenimonas sp.]|nr:iron-sulfur cluster assembly scaffold protein IscU/NifU-like [Hydrogenimonas sp.]
MAKQDLIGGDLGGLQPEGAGVDEQPENQGELTEEDAKRLGGELIVADFGAESCGDAVRLYWIVDPKTDKILEAKFKLRMAEQLSPVPIRWSNSVKGKTVDGAVKITNIDVEKAMRDTPETLPFLRRRCTAPSWPATL